MLNSFELVKQAVTPKQVATKYLGSPAKWGNTYMYKSPFRNEKTASFAVSDIKGFTDFASGWHSDMFGFVKELYTLSNRHVALKIKAKDTYVSKRTELQNKADDLSVVMKNDIIISRGQSKSH
ncbi:MAG: CHC2 zinc finger domain-containing protein [Clostridia bacterium]